MRVLVAEDVEDLATAIAAGLEVSVSFPAIGAER
jgi:hypothetical protein